MGFRNMQEKLEKYYDAKANQRDALKANSKEFQ